MIKLNKWVYFFTAIAMCLSFTGCGHKDTGKKIGYKKLSFADSKTLFNTKECLRFGQGIKQGNNVVLVSEHVWLIDLETGKEQKLFENGVGPAAIPYPSEGYLHNGEVYINSFNMITHLFHFSFAEAEKRELKFLKFGETGSLAFDDFAFISNDVVALVCPYWKEGYLNFFDFSQKKRLPPTSIKPTFGESINILTRNSMKLCVCNDRLFITESIVPVINVFDVKRKILEEKIRLAPPFYVPYTAFPPPKANDDKFDNKKTTEWLAKWTKIYDISCNNGWILVHYKFGYTTQYCYELINIANPLHRYYIDVNPNCVIDFTVTGKHVEFILIEELDETMAWKKCEIDLQ